MADLKKGIRVAFGCQARVGKSEAAKIIISKYGGVEYSFASPLYDILHFAQETCNFEINKDRYFLQTVGTWARQQNENTWVDIMKQKILQNPLDSNIIVSDVRFPNEAEMLKKCGFTLIRIKRNDAHSIFTNDVANNGGSISHESENQLSDDDFHFVIDNNSTLKDLQIQLMSIVNTT